MQISFTVVLVGMLPCKPSTVKADPGNHTSIGNADNSSSTKNSDNENISNEGRKLLTAGQTKLNPTQLDSESDKTGHLSNPEIIEKELTTLPPDAIKKYPLVNVPGDELVIVLTNISIPTLEKTLENIPDSDLVQIFNSKLPQDKSRQILDRLPQDKSRQILDRMTSQSLK